MRANLLSLLICSWLFSLAAQAAAIHDAAKSGDISALSIAISQGADVNARSGLITPLYIAARYGHLDAVRILIKAGADVNLPAGVGYALAGACQGGYTEIVKLLLDNGADPNLAWQSVTPLHRASGTGCFECVKMLVDHGADVNALTSQRTPPLHLAKNFGHEEIADYLRAHGAARPVPPPISKHLNKADATRGKSIFDKQCGQCHRTTQDPPHHSDAPYVWDVVGQPRASQPDFDYSPAFTEAPGIWTYEELNTFLSGPALTWPGTAMAFPGLTEEADRADVIMFLRTLSENPAPLP